MESGVDVPGNEVGTALTDGESFELREKRDEVMSCQ